MLFLATSLASCIRLMICHAPARGMPVMSTNGSSGGRQWLPVAMLLSLAMAPAAAAMPDCGALVHAEAFSEELDACFVAAISDGGAELQELLDADFFYNTMRGTRIDAEQLRAWLRDARDLSVELRSEEHDVRRIGPVALTTGIMAGAGCSRYLHVWVRTPHEGWRLLARQVTEVRAESAGGPHQGGAPDK